MLASMTVTTQEREVCYVSTNLNQAQDQRRQLKVPMSQLLIVGVSALLLWPVMLLVDGLHSQSDSQLQVPAQVLPHDIHSSISQRRLADAVAIDKKHEAASAVHLFTPASFTTVGPSVFPKPSALLGEDALPYLQPTYGQHRADADAVFVFAAEYGLNTYICFVESLRKTGFTGDVVFAVSILDMKEKGVEPFLRNSPNIITYVLELSCFNAEMEASSSSKGGMRVCQLHHLYADAEGKPMEDPREARTIATTRYELYWLWSLHYEPHVWVMLLDARDSYFQTNPFDTVPRESDPTNPSGILHFFGENAEATRIGKSPKNRKWLTNAYGDVVVAALEDKPTICSGSTMGEKVAIEVYLRAMVAESDETGTKLMGADQGFHNYLYYSNKLGNSINIRSITVFDQGRGAINNLGAMRTAPLEEWGNGQILDLQSNTSMTVLNWDGSVSPVMHQFDRHQVLSKFVYKYKTGLLREAYFAKSVK